MGTDEDICVDSSISSLKVSQILDSCFQSSQTFLKSFNPAQFTPLENNF